MSAETRHSSTRTIAGMVAVARLRKEDLKHPYKIPQKCDQRQFTQHGKDLNISFDGKMMTTTVYINMDI